MRLELARKVLVAAPGEWVRVTGSIEDESGVALSGVRTVVSPGSTRIETVSGPNGFFGVEVQAPEEEGPIAVWATAQGALRSKVLWLVVAGEQSRARAPAAQTLTLEDVRALMRHQDGETLAEIAYSLKVDGEMLMEGVDEARYGRGVIERSSLERALLVRHALGGATYPFRCIAVPVRSQSVFVPGDDTASDAEVASAVVTTFDAERSEALGLIDTWEDAGLVSRADAALLKTSDTLTIALCDYRVPAGEDGGYSATNRMVMETFLSGAFFTMQRVEAGRGLVALNSPEGDLMGLTVGIEVLELGF